MQTETLEQNALVKIVETSGLEQTTAQELIKSFEPFYSQMMEWKEKALKIVVTDATQLTEMAQAKEMRLALMRIRTGSDKLREAKKADALKYGNTIQSLYNLIKDTVIPLEKHLQEQEDFAKIQELKRKSELAQSRLTELQQYDFVYNTGFDLGNMDETMYQSLLAGIKKTKEDKIAAEKKADEDRLEKEKITNLHNERKESILHLWVYTELELRTQNLGQISESDWTNIVKSLNQEKTDDDKKQAKIKSDNEKLKKENEKIAAQADADRKAKAKLEADIKAKSDADAEAKKDADDKAEAELKAKLAAEKKLAKAGDKEKIQHWLNTWINVEPPLFPVVKEESSEQILSDITLKFSSFKTWAKKQTQSI